MDPLQLLERLERLRPPDLLDRVALLANMPGGLRPSTHLIHAARCQAVLEWAAAPNGCGLDSLDLAVDRALLAPPEDDRADGNGAAAAVSVADDRVARHLLFGVLAVQMDLIDAEQFTDVCAGWTTHKHASLADLLEQRGWITRQDREFVEQFVERKLKKHGGDAPATLRASVDDTTREAIRSSNTPEIRDSLPDMSAGQNGAADGADPFDRPAGDSRYRWTRLHRQGGLGQVWLARDAHFERDVAVKTLKPDRLDQPAARQRLHHEAQITGRLEHPNIVPVYELGRRGDDGKPYYTMRFLRGQTLFDRIAEHHHQKVEGRLNPIQRRRLLGIFLDVCDAVAYAHSQGVIHLDIKPENVLLGEFGEVSLLDWGLARPLASLETDAAPAADGTVVAASDETLPATRPESAPKPHPVGTPAYMAPEQAACRWDRIGPRTDIYGLGASLFETLTGHAPHEGESVDAVVQKIVDGPTPLAREVEPATPPPLERIVARAMDKDPHERYDTVQDLAAAVRHWLDEEPLETYRSEIAHFQALCAENPEKREYREHLARNCVNLALVLCGMNRQDEAEQFHQQAIDLYRGLIEEFPAVARRLRADLAATLLHRRNALLSLGRAADAELMHRDAINEYGRLLKAHPQDEYYRSLFVSLASRTQAQQLPRPSDTAELTGAGGIANYYGPPKLAIESLEPPRFRLSSLAGIERNWLLATFASRLGRATPQSLADAMHAWLEDQAVDVGAYLVRYADLPPPDCEALNGLVADHVNRLTPTNPEYTPPTAHPSLAAQYSASQTTANLPDFASESDNPLRSISGDRFHLQKKLGEGGLSSVFLAYDNALEREVAIKSLQERLQDRPNSREALLREAKITGNMEHVGILPIYDLGVYADGTPFFAMRRVRGQSLDELARDFHGDKSHASRDEFLRGLGRLVDIFVQVCRTVEYAHGRGVLHRDLKPQNIMTTGSGETFVIDWGLAIALHPERESEPEGQIVGTPSFMSPEQARGDVEAIERRSDIYTLGATLHFLLTGKPPFTGSVRSTLDQVMRGEFLSTKLDDPAIPAPLRAICRKAMAFSPADRYASAPELTEDLERWQRGDAVSVYRDPWRQRLARELRRRPLAAILAAAIAAALAGMGLAALAL